MYKVKGPGIIIRPFRGVDWLPTTSFFPLGQGYPFFLPQAEIKPMTYGMAVLSVTIQPPGLLWEKSWGKFKQI